MCTLRAKDISRILCGRNLSHDLMNLYCQMLNKISKIPVECLTNDYYENRDRYSKDRNGKTEETILVYKMYSRWVCCHVNKNGHMTLYNAKPSTNREDTAKFLYCAYNVKYCKIQIINLSYLICKDEVSGVYTLAYTSMLAFGKTPQNLNQTEIRRYVLTVIEKSKKSSNIRKRRFFSCCRRKKRKDKKTSKNNNKVQTDNEEDDDGDVANLEIVVEKIPDSDSKNNVSTPQKSDSSDVVTTPPHSDTEINYMTPQSSDTKNDEIYKNNITVKISHKVNQCKFGEPSVSIHDLTSCNIEDLQINYHNFNNKLKYLISNLPLSDKTTETKSLYLIDQLKTESIISAADDNKMTEENYENKIEGEDYEIIFEPSRKTVYLTKEEELVLEIRELDTSRRKLLENTRKTRDSRDLAAIYEYDSFLQHRIDKLILRYDEKVAVYNFERRLKESLELRKLKQQPYFPLFLQLLRKEWKSKVPSGFRGFKFVLREFGGILLLPVRGTYKGVKHVLKFVGPMERIFLVAGGFPVSGCCVALLILL